MWNIIHKAVNVLFLLIATSLLVLLWGSTKNSSDVNKTAELLTKNREETSKIISTNSAYIEDKIMRLSYEQNSYQNTIFGKMTIIENRLETLEKSEKNNNKQSVTNNNSNVINLYDRKQEQ